MKFALTTLRAKHEPAIPVWKDERWSFMNPQREWMLGFLTAVIIFIVGISFIAYDFYIQFGVPAQPVTAEYGPVVYDEKAVVRYALMYEQKERAFDALRGKALLPLAEN